MGVHMRLGISDLVPAFNAPSVSHQSQECIRGCAAVEKAVFVDEGFAVSASCGDDVNDPARIKPSLTDVLLRLFRLQPPWDNTALADLVIRWLAAS